MPDWIKILADIDVDEGDLDSWQCPNCGWETDGGYYDDPSMCLEVGEFIPTTNLYHSFSAGTWMEKWRCPECGTVWEFENDNI